MSGRQSRALIGYTAGYISFCIVEADQELWVVHCTKEIAVRCRNCRLI
jgi:hypothetical protein